MVKGFRGVYVPNEKMIFCVLYHHFVKITNLIKLRMSYSTLVNNHYKSHLNGNPKPIEEPNLNPKSDGEPNLIPIGKSPSPTMDFVDNDIVHYITDHEKYPMFTEDELEDIVRAMVDRLLVLMSQIFVPFYDDSGNIMWFNLSQVELYKIANDRYRCGNDPISQVFWLLENDWTHPDNKKNPENPFHKLPNPRSWIIFVIVELFRIVRNSYISTEFAEVIDAFMNMIGSFPQLLSKCQYTIRRDAIKGDSREEIADSQKDVARWFMSNLSPWICSITEIIFEFLADVIDSVVYNEMYKTCTAYKIADIEYSIAVDKQSRLMDAFANDKENMNKDDEEKIIAFLAKLSQK